MGIDMVKGMDLFSKDLEALLDEQKVPYCYQCSRCTSACPTALVNETFNPRRIILQVLLEEDLDPIEEDVIWHCVSCHSCEEACPKGVRVAGIIHLLCNDAFRKGKAPKASLTNVDLLLKSGMVASFTGVERSRSKVGLGEVRTPDVEEIRRLIEGTALSTRGGAKDAKKGGER